MSEDVEKLRGYVPRLRSAVTLRERVESAAGKVLGGAPSYELVSIAALSLLQDIASGCASHEKRLRAELGQNWHPPKQLDDALRRLGIAIDALSDVTGASQTLSDALGDTQVWVKRSQLVLREARAPYALLGDDGQPTLCPVIEWENDAAVECSAPLLVHRNPETGVPQLVKCKHRRYRHEWPSGPAWLRLGALLAQQRESPPVEEAPDDEACLCGSGLTCLSSTHDDDDPWDDPAELDSRAEYERGDILRW